MLFRPKGLPIAIAHCPATIVSEFASLTVGKLFASILITATSVTGSAPMTLPAKLLPSWRTTVTSSASSTTWALVKMRPSELIINPEPLPRTTRGLGNSLPKNAQSKDF